MSLHLSTISAASPSMSVPVPMVFTLMRFVALLRSVMTVTPSAAYI